MKVGPEPEVMYCYTFDKEFPKDLKEAVYRENLIESLIGTLNDAQIVFLEGEEGIGSSVFLGQFCQTHPENTISLFIKPASKLGYTPLFIKSKLAEQYYWYVNKKPLIEERFIEKNFPKYYYKFKSKVKRDDTIYFVVDGLHQIPNTDRGMIEKILKEILPIGLSDNFKFIITGPKLKYDGLMEGKIYTKNFWLPKFTLEELKKYFHDIEIDEDKVNEIGKICNKIPRSLSIIKRHLKAGETYESLFSENEYNQVFDFIEMDFHNLDYLNEKENRAISVICYNETETTIDDLAGIVGEDGDFTEKLIAKCKFLVFDKNSVEFRSEAHRKYAISKKFSVYKRDAIKLIVAYLNSDSSGDSANKANITKYLEQLGDYSEILRLLNPEYCRELLNQTQSISFLKSIVTIGLSAAQKQENSEEVCKFSLESSLLLSLANESISKNRIKALVSLRKPQIAIDMATSMPTKEKRLALLAAYANCAKQVGYIIEPEFIEYIRNLKNQSNFAYLGDKAIDIAVDLIAVDPDLAVSIIEEAESNKSIEKKDNAYIKLLVHSKLENGVDAGELEKKTLKKISSKQAKDIVESIGVMLSDISAHQMIEKMSLLDGKGKILFLRTWLEMHAERDDSIIASEYMLDLLVTESTYTPKAKDLCCIAQPLARCESLPPAKIDEIIAKLDIQKRVIHQFSSKIDEINLEMLLAEAELRFDQDRAINRILETYYEISGWKNLENKVECYAWMLKALQLFDSENKLENEHGFKNVIQTELTESLEMMLQDSAEHYYAVKGVIIPLVDYNLEQAIKIANSLNVESRRNKCLDEIAEKIASNSYSLAAANYLIDCFDKISDIKLKEKSILVCIRQILKNDDSEKWVETVSILISKLRWPDIRCKAILEYFRLVKKANLTINIEPLIDEFDSILNKIWSSKLKLSILFNCAEALSHFDIELANKYYAKAEEIEKKSPICSSDVEDVFFMLGQLLIRALSNLIVSNSIDSSIMARFRSFVNQIPCLKKRAALYNVIAMKALSLGKRDIASDIYDGSYSDLLQEAKSCGDEVLSDITEILWPSMFLINNHVADENAKNILTRSGKDNAILYLADLVIKKAIPIDPDSNDDLVYPKISYEDARNVISSLKNCDTDHIFCVVVEDLVNSILSNANKISFTPQQKSNLYSSLIALIDQKLPDLNNIKHDGYKIYAYSLAYSLTNTSKSDWENLINDADQINNIADKGLIFLKISESTPEKHSHLKRDAFERAEKLFYQIPSSCDRLTRLTYLSESKVVKLFSGNYKKYIQDAFLLSVNVSDEDFATKMQRKILDIAYKIDQDYAESIADSIDDDPARAFARSEISHRMSINKGKDSIVSPNHRDHEKISAIENLPQIAWMGLRSLVYGKSVPIKPEFLMQHLIDSSQLDFMRAYPVHSFYIENLSKKNVHNLNEKSIRLHKELLESLLSTIELSLNLAGQYSLALSQYYSDDDTSSSILIKSNDDREAFQLFISDFLKSETDVNEIIICDPYFSPSDIDILKTVLLNLPSASVYILTSIHALKKSNAMTKDSFACEWKRISDQPLPYTEIIAISTDPDDKIVIHDRWFLAGNRGLRLGTSLNSIGNKLAETSKMSEAQSALVHEELKEYISRTKRIHNDRRVNYSGFTL